MDGNIMWFWIFCILALLAIIFLFQKRIVSRGGIAANIWVLTMYLIGKVALTCYPDLLNTLLDKVDRVLYNHWPEVLGYMDYVREFAKNDGAVSPLLLASLLLLFCQLVIHFVDLLRQHWKWTRQFKSTLPPDLLKQTKSYSLAFPQRLSDKAEQFLQSSGILEPGTSMKVQTLYHSRKGLPLEFLEAMACVGTLLIFLGFLVNWCLGSRGELTISTTPQEVSSPKNNLCLLCETLSDTDLEKTSLARWYAFHRMTFMVSSCEERNERVTLTTSSPDWGTLFISLSPGKASSYRYITLNLQGMVRTRSEISDALSQNLYFLDSFSTVINVISRQYPKKSSYLSGSDAQKFPREERGTAKIHYSIQPGGRMIRIGIFIFIVGIVGILSGTRYHFIARLDTSDCLQFKVHIAILAQGTLASSDKAFEDLKQSFASLLT